MYTLVNDTPPDPAHLRAILERTGSFDWRSLFIDVPAPQLGACLSMDIGEIDAIVREVGSIKASLQTGYPAGDGPGDGVGRAADAPGQTGVPRATAQALEPFTDLQATTGVSARELGELANQHAILRAIEIYAGRMHDGAIDGRLLTGAYGWFLISSVCDGLRHETKGLQPKEAEALLSPFAPMLVLIGQVMEERDALSKQSRKEAAALAAEAEAAQADREDAEAALRLRGVPRDVPRATIAKLASRAEAPPPASKKGARRTRR